MADAGPVLDQVNLVVKDMNAALAFYRRLGLAIADPPDWPPGSGARHAEVAMPNGTRLEFDNYAMVAIWHPGWRDGGGASEGSSRTKDFGGCSCRVVCWQARAVQTPARRRRSGGSLPGSRHAG